VTPRPERDLAQWLDAVRAEYWQGLASHVEEPPAGEPHVLFQLGSGTFALGAPLCKGVVRPGRVARLPGTPPFVLGVCGVRGEVVSATDPRVLLGLPERGDQGGYFLILGDGRLKTALWVDWVDDVVAIDRGEMVTEGGAFPEAPAGVVRGRWLRGAGPLHVIDGRRYLEVTAVRRDRAPG
jgi:purine-binding chemotaxis protein CheW